MSGEVNGERSSPNRFPMRAFAVAVMGTVGLLLVTSWVIWRSYLEYESTLVRDLRLQSLISIVEDSSDVATIARAMARTGELDDYDVYLTQSSELHEAVDAIIEMTTDDPDLFEHSRAMEMENKRLAHLEEQAFVLLQDGNTAEAKTLLWSDQYLGYLAAFNMYTDNFEEALAVRIDEDIDSLKQKALFSFGVVTAVVPFLLLIWVAILRTAKFHLDERNLMEEELRSMTLHDDLTQLYNRRGFTMLSEQQWLLARRSNRTMLLVFCDLDELKRINDTHGHRWGDEAIRLSARLIEETFRESDIIGRIGGDEFVILLTDTSDVDFEMFRRRLRHNILESNEKSDLPFKLSISIGFAWWKPNENRTLTEVLAEADATMYEEKKSRDSNPMLTAGT